MNFLKNHFLWMLFFLSTTIINAQIEVATSVDKDSIKIGEQFNLDIRVETDESTVLQWPVLLDSVGDFEIVSNTAIKKSLAENGRKVEEQKIRLTSFDEGYKAIPGLVFKYTDENSRIRQTQSKGIMVGVMTMAVDTSKGITPIKAIIEVPLTWKDLLPKIIKYAAIALGVLLLIGLLIYFLRKNKTEEVEEIKIKAPAHEVALSKLKSIEKSKSWEVESTKLYYSQLTDILREYVENKFELPALESTSDEIIEDLSQTEIADGLQRKMSNILTLSDLAKFAKASPTAENNKQCLKDAIVFVEHTKNLRKEEEEEEVVEAK